MNVIELNEGTGSANLTPSSLAAHSIATIPLPLVACPGASLAPYRGDVEHPGAPRRTRQLRKMPYPSYAGTDWCSLSYLRTQLRPSFNGFLCTMSRKAGNDRLYPHTWEPLRLLGLQDCVDRDHRMVLQHAERAVASTRLPDPVDWLQQII
jgi:hypothetical protein